MPDYLRNIAAVMQLPLIALNWRKDIWNKLRRYSELEEKFGSTFFFMPYKNEPGCRAPAGAHCTSLRRRRAARYDVRDYSPDIKDLVHKGHEIGLQGLDAWCDPELGRKELNVIRSLAGERKVGVRMHWLFYDRHTHRKLHQAGFDYDSSAGYDDSIGFRSGTAQAYRMSGGDSVMELPLIVQDTAMFFKGRMALDEKKAAIKCAKLIERIQNSGGVFTVNWHQRSIAPERNWERFYLDLINEVKSCGPWFTTCRRAVEWFRMRRRVRFEYLVRGDSRPVLRVSHIGKEGLPEPVLRRYHPGSGLLSNVKRDLPLIFNDEVLAGTIEFHPRNGSVSEVS
jgi:hypothetical protein